MSLPLVLLLVVFAFAIVVVFALALCMAAARGDRLVASASDEHRASRDLYPTARRVTLAAVKNAPASGDTPRGHTHREDTSNEHASS